MKVEATQRGITKALARWQKLRRRKGAIEAERDATLEPIRQRFEQRCAPVLARAQAKLDPVERELAEVEDAIVTAFMGAVDKRGHFRFTRVANAAAVAEVITRQERELDPKVFFESIPESQRTAAFWSCLRTLIGKAERFLGSDRVNQLAHARQTHQIKIAEVSPE